MIKRNPSLRLIFGAFAALGSALALAQTPTLVDFASTSVSFRDLDLSRDADARRLYERLQHAAGKVCRPVGNSKIENEQYRSCADAALDRAVLLVNSARVQALHEAKKSAHGQG